MKSPRRRSNRRRSNRRSSRRRSAGKRKTHRLPGETLEKCVGRKIGILRHEGYPQRQSIAIAYSVCGEKR